MRFICLGYADEKKWNAMSKDEQRAMMEECLACDEELWKSSHWLGAGEALQSVRTARTLRRQSGKLLVTDGPFAETKEQLGGFGVLEAEDMDHAVELLSKHPGVRHGPFEIRPVDEEMGERCKAAVAAPGTLAEGTKFICLGYWAEENWNALSKSEREAHIEESIAYGETLRQHGDWVGGEALQSARTAKTLRSKAGRVLVTDGPYAETKEQLGGVAVFKFKDMDHAVELWSNHPCLRIGDCLEIRPADEEIDALIAERQQRIEMEATRRS